jgi:signal transduction histidine kinase/ActR/RegA family two-component response regulator
MSNEDAGRHHPVDLTATVNLHRPGIFYFTVQQNGTGMYLMDERAKKSVFQQGDLVRIVGTTEQGGYSPVIVATEVQRIAQGPAPEPVHLDMGELRTGEHENVLIEVEATVQSVRRRQVPRPEDSSLRLELRSGDLEFHASVAIPDDFPTPAWAGKRVRLRGIHSLRTNGRGNRVGSAVVLDSPAEVQVLSSGEQSLSSTSAQISELFTHLSKVEEGELVELFGEVTWITESGDVWLQSGISAVLVQPAEPMIVAEGDRLTVKGQLERSKLGDPVLRRSRIVNRLPGRHKLRPHLLSELDIRFTRFAGALVSVEGVVLSVESLNDRKAIRFAVYHWTFTAYLPVWLSSFAAQLNPGDRIAVSGIAELATHPGTLDTYFTIRPRSQFDLRLISHAPWWQRFPWGKAMGFAVLLMAGAGAWIWLLRRRVQQQTAYLSQQAEALRQHGEELETARRQAEEANSAKSRFLAAISHELRTPLNGLLGFSELLAASALTPQQEDWVRTISASNQLLHSMLNDLLDLSKIQAGGMTLEQIPFSPEEVINSTVELLRPRAAEKRLILQTQIDPFVRQNYSGDPTRVRQILMNLISNAIKFTEKGSVQVLASPYPDAGLQLEVIDSGIGISADALARLFQPFTQADSSTSRRFGGTGLGLSICRDLVALMGGTITCESMPGVGSRFVCRLPLSPTEAVLVLPPSSPVEEELDGLRVLLVEDNAVNQKLASHFLQSFGCAVELARDGQEAIDLAALDRYDLILMDCHMPRMDGYDATAHIRRSSGPNAGTPILALTANTAQEDITRCLAAGMNAWMSKPIRRDELAQMLRKHRLESSQPLPDHRT